MSRTRCSALRGAPQSRDPESKPRMDPGSAAQRWRAAQHAGDARPIPPEWNKKIMPSKITIDGEVIMASDAPPGHFHQPQGFSVSLQVADPADAERRLKAVAEGGSINMPCGKTFFSKGFGMCVDQFGTPWMVNCPMEEG